MRAKYQRFSSIGIGDMNTFRNFNADIKTRTQTLCSRLRSQRSYIWCTWKGIVKGHVCAKYQWRNSIGKGDMNNFRNFNANLETLT